MPLISLPGIEALRLRRANPNASWPNREIIPNRVEPYATPNFHKHFSLNREDGIFTMGSCFAREIESALQSKGFTIPVLDFVDNFMRSGGSGLGSNFDRSILNQYGAPSVFNQMKWAFDSENYLDPSIYSYEILPGRYIDLDLPAYIKPAPLEDVIARRNALTDCTRSLKNCKVLILTLGLSELWWDSLASCYRNTALLPRVLQQSPERFELHVLSYNELLAFTNNAIAIVKRIVPDVNILLTISPVPLNATHTNNDVMVANSYSKSVLRAVAEEVVCSNDFVHYYPSYEIVTLSKRDLAWEDDLIHVKPSLVKRITSRMTSIYCDDGNFDGDLSSLIERAKSEFASVSAKSSSEIFSYINERIHFIKTDPDLSAMSIEQFLRFSNFEDARILFESCSDNLSDFNKNFFASRISFYDQDYDVALRLIRNISPGDPNYNTGAFYRQAAAVFSELDIFSDFISIINKWTLLWPTRAEPLFVLASYYAVHGMKEDARKAFENALSREWDSPTVIIGFCNFMIDCGELDDAKELVVKATPINSIQKRELNRLRQILSLPLVSE